MPDNSAADFFATPAFLDDAQILHAIRCAESNGMVTCGLSRSFYAKWVLFGVVLGVVPTFALLGVPAAMRAFRSAPLAPQVMVVLVLVLGWHLLLRGLLSRRSVVFDFVAGRATFFKGYPTYGVVALDLREVQELKCGTEPGFGRDGRHAPTAHVILLLLKDGRTIKVLKTLDARAADGVRSTLAAASQGKLG